jgi:RNA polymerase sigma factor (TIGR02999 family)
MTSNDSNSPDPAAPSADRDVLFDAVYERLKLMAGNARRRGRDTLDTTELVHELYLRIGGDAQFSHPAKFFAYAAGAMRHLLADRARNRLRLKAGGDWLRVTFPEDGELATESAEQVLALEDAMQQLATLDARAAQVVELRYYAGLSLRQIAEALDLAPRTIDRDWQFACAFLKSELSA